MREHLYQKCLRCPWLWGCGLWWCSQWWRWLWGCSTETPADPLGSPKEITHNSSGIVDYFILFSHWSPFFCSLWILFLPLAACVLSIYLSASPYSLLSLLPPACCHISPGSITAARNDITHYILSHLLSSPPPSSFPFLSHPPSYSRCHRCMVWAPSRKSACWPGPACWGGWTPLLWGHSCWTGRSLEPAGIESSGPPSHMGILRKDLTQHSPDKSQWCMCCERCSCLR